jgi:hypothetical protein
MLYALVCELVCERIIQVGEDTNGSSSYNSELRNQRLAHASAPTHALSVWYFSMHCPAPSSAANPLQVVQQQQQVQMSFAWSFLHVGQSMTANVFHASAASGGGPKAARRLAKRIVGWAAGSCVMLALLTYHNRCAGLHHTICCATLLRLAQRAAGCHNS